MYYKENETSIEKLNKYIDSALEENTDSKEILYKLINSVRKNLVKQI